MDAPVTLNYHGYELRILLDLKFVQFACTFGFKVKME